MTTTRWEVTRTRPCHEDSCLGTVTTQRRDVHMALAPCLADMADDEWENVSGADWCEQCDTCDYADADPFTY